MDGSYGSYGTEVAKAYAYASSALVSLGSLDS